MTCAELRQDYTSYALGVAEDPERVEITAHLGRKCPNCVLGVTSALATVTAMSGAVRLTEPPRHLRRRVMAAVEKKPTRSRAATFAPWAITAAMSLALVAIGLSGRRQIGDTAKLTQALSILNDPATKDVTFGETGKPASREAAGRAFLNAGKGIVLIGASLPRLDPDKTFELWAFPAKGNPLPAGLFRSQSDSTAVFVGSGPADPSLMEKAQVAVTVEPQGGSAQPTTKPIIVAKF
jgi:hypothetical protein